MRLISRLFLFVFLFFKLFYSQGFYFSITNDDFYTQLHQRQSIQYDRKDLNNFSIISSKLNSAFLYTRSYGTIGQVSTIALDGGLSSHTKIGWNGICVDFPQLSSVDASLLPLELSSSFEMYRDNLSSYGIFGQGGFVNFLSTSYGKENLIEAYIQEYNTYGGKVILNSFSDNFDGRVGVSTTFSSNNFVYVDEYGFSNTAKNLDFDRLAVSGDFSFPFAKLSLAHTYKNGGTGISYNLSGRQKDIFTLAGLSTKLFDIELKTSFINWENFYTLEKISSDRHLNRTFSFDLQKSFLIFGLKNTFKPQLKYFWLDSTKIGQKEESQIDLIYCLGYEYEKFLIDFSVDSVYRRNEINFIPSFGSSFNIFEGVKIFGSISRGFLYPSFNDLYWPEDVFAKGNENLKPEDGLRWQVGSALLIIPFYLNLSYSESYIENQILWKPVLGKWQPENIGKVFSRVFNFTIRIEDNFFDFKLLSDISFSYNYSINNDPTSIYYEKRIIYVPLYKWNIDFGLSYKDIFLTKLSYRHVSERFTTEANTVWLKPYGILDLNLLFYFFYFTIENLLDAQYEELSGYPQPGRIFKIGISVKF